MKTPSDSPPPNLPSTGEETADPQGSLKADAAFFAEQTSVGEFYQTADPLLYPILKKFVAEHRKQPTKAEDFLWQQLRGSKLAGYSFRRQHIIDCYIADFVCLAKALVIEVDGLIHQLPENNASDETRTLRLNSKGYAVLRFTNDEVLHNIETTLTKIEEKLGELPFLPKKIFLKAKDPANSEGSADASLAPLGEGPGMGAYYLNEKGLVTLTAKYLLQRGYCCGNGCKHCPYHYEAVPEPRRSDLLKQRGQRDSL